MVIYVIEKGDTVFNIAERFNASPEKIIEANGLTNLDNLVVGQSIVLPINVYAYEIKKGDTLYKLSQRFNVSVDAILNENPDISNADMLSIGQIVLIPVGVQPIGKMEVNGYIYPNISNSTLSKTLPNLTYVSIFSYDINADGSLNTVNDDRIIEQAKLYGVVPMMVITNFDNEEGRFSGELANEVFTNSEARRTLYNNVIQTALSKGYGGINVDFEYLFPSDRQNYVNFLTELKAETTANNLKLFVALAPKISGEQQGTLYEAHDYEQIGKIADRIILMTYEWGYLYGEPQAVSPIKPIMQVLDYAVTVIESSKILMGVSNYGYDWKLPYVQGTPATILSNMGAVDLAREKGAFIEYDETAQAPFFTYNTTENEHIVWFDDARSYLSRFKLVDKYNLAGISYWTLNNYFPSMFQVQNGLYETIKL